MKGTKGQCVLIFVFAALNMYATRLYPPSSKSCYIEEEEEEEQEQEEENEDLFTTSEMYTHDNTIMAHS